jgi:methylmalonyl-CoA mutase, C-terminal domain
MTEKKIKVKVILAQFPLETHSRGIIAVANILKDAGMEVIPIGNALPEKIIDAAIQQDGNVIGISTYCGGELILAKDLLRAAKKKEIKNKMVFLMGGIITPENATKLKKLGFSGVFPPSADKDAIINCIKSSLHNIY